jgi:hypothetical protein
MATTSYTVDVKYLVDDKASRGLNNIGKNAQLAATGTSALSGQLTRLAATAASYFGMRQAKKYLVDFNTELEQSKQTMTTLLTQNMGGAWETNQKRANKLIKQFQQDSAKSAGTTKDYVDIAKMITGPLAQAGAEMEDLRKVTQRTVVASRVYGIQSEVAARDLQSMLMGNTKNVDLFARMLGVVPEKWNKMVKDKGPQRAIQETLKLFDNPALVRATKEYGKTWAGITSTLEDNIDRALGKVGVPLMQKLLDQTKQLNKWFDENPRKLGQIINTMADGLVKAFDIAKGITGFIVENKTLLMTIAKAYLVSKAANVLTTGILSPIGALQSLSNPLRSAGDSARGFGAALASGAARMQGVVSLLGTVYIGAKAIAGAVEQRQERQIEKKTSGAADINRRRMEAFTGRGSETVRRQAQQRAGQLGFFNSQEYLARQLVTAARAKGLIKGDKVVGSGVDIEKKFGFLDYGKSWAGLPKDLENALQIDRQIRGREQGLAFQNFIAEFRKTPKEFAGAFLDGAVDFFNMFNPFKVDKKSRARPADVNVKVQIDRVESNDPDRFAFGLQGAFQDIAANPTQARNAFREGV